MIGCQGVEKRRIKSNRYILGLYGSTKTRNNDVNHLSPNQGDIVYFKSKGSIIEETEQVGG